MKYTIRGGVTHQLSERINDNLHFILPALIIVAGILFFLLNPGGPSRGAKPLTLGIYTVNTGSSKPNNPNKPNSSGSQSNSGSGSTNLSGLTQGQTMNPQLGSASLLPPPAPSSSGLAATPPSASGTSGGLGGGDLSGTGGGTSTGVPPTPPPPPAPTVVCTNTLSLAQICTACTPPLTLMPGQKALLSADGTCIAVN
jgi:hypothetical protein